MTWFPLKHSTELFFIITSTWYISICKHVASKKFHDKLKIYKKKCEEKGNSMQPRVSKFVSKDLKLFPK